MLLWRWQTGTPQICSGHLLGSYAGEATKVKAGDHKPTYMVLAPGTRKIAKITSYRPMSASGRRLQYYCPASAASRLYQISKSAEWCNPKEVDRLTLQSADDCSVAQLKSLNPLCYKCFT
ncbi:hypothetical protein EDD22DRAFT_845618 [Suillus occidentalis]|nr:hypothetical protein EDD22DRAFT_845618 [Suillus occidentalis]